MSQEKDQTPKTPADEQQNGQEDQNQGEAEFAAPDNSSSPHPKQPTLTTALIVLGEAMFFQPDDETVLSLTLYNKEEMSSSLLETQAIPQNSLEVIHVVVKSSVIGRLYNDEDAIPSYAKYLQEGGEVTVHVLGNEGSPSDDDMETIRLSLILAELRIELNAETEDGSRIMTGRKLGGENMISMGDDDDDDDDKQVEEAE